MKLIPIVICGLASFAPSALAKLPLAQWCETSPVGWKVCYSAFSPSVTHLSVFDADGEIKASVTMMCPFGTGNTAGYVDPDWFGGSDVIEYQWDEFCNAK